MEKSQQAGDYKNHQDYFEHGFFVDDFYRCNSKLCSPDFETVRKEFGNNESSINSLVEIFLRESKVSYIKRYRSGMIDIT